VAGATPAAPLVASLAAALARHPARTGLFSDFDGTLAPIVDDPATAAPLPGVRDALGALAARLGRVAVVSGRPAAFLDAHLGGLGLELWGLYGLERATAREGGGVEVATPEAGRWAAVVEDVTARARAEVGDRLDVEHKRFSLTLHFRTRPEHESLARAWADLAAAATGLVVHPARMSYELRLPLARDKGTVVAELAAGLRTACFLGDDRGDLDAFDALDRLAAATAATVLRVAVRSPEAPPELLARADLVVDGPPGVLEFLRAVLAAT
jgi:trehalose 6-phosphate phosphatase